MARTGYIVTVYQDINPSSSTYNQTREDRELDAENCPSSAQANWIEYNQYCELDNNGMQTGYEITVYRDVEPLSSTYNQTREDRVLNTTDCESDETNPNWQNIGEPYCRQIVYMPGGLMGNDGYMVQQQQDMNEYSPTADQIRDVATEDLEHCPTPNTEPVWDIISESCHTTIYEGQIVYDGTKDIIRVNTNQYSTSWNDGLPETLNVPDNIHCQSGTPDFTAQYFTLEAIEDGTFTFTGANSNSLSYTIDDGQTWIPLASGVASPTVTAGNKIMWKGNCTPNTTSLVTGQWGIGTFSSSGNAFKAYGNTMSLVYGDNFQNSTTMSNYQFCKLFSGSKVIDAKYLILPSTTLTEYCYYLLFEDCHSLTTAPVLPATTLARWCYQYMFSGCSSLVNAPELPATTLAEVCYWGMFQYCTSMITSPELPATTMVKQCYQQMFEGCTSLTTTPALPATTFANACYSFMLSGTNLLPDCTNIDFTSLTVVASGGLKGLFGGTKVTNANLQQLLPKDSNNRYCLPVTTLATGCYDEMFSGCTYLTTAPVLPATTLSKSCYNNMFTNCMNLTTAPALPATTLTQNCYGYMFSGCSSLTTPPALPATTLAIQCYRGMFSGCTSLTSTPALPATTLAESCYESMFQDCTSLTSTPQLSATTLAKYCYRRMFWNCTSLVNAPALSATSLRLYCYMEMFRDCTSLVNAPQLPATTMIEGCYEYMFQGCTSLTTAPTLPATTLRTYCYYRMFYDCTNLNSIICLATNINATACTREWLYNVASSGTFVKDANMSSWTTGGDGIPSGWTVVNQ